VVYSAKGEKDEEITYDREKGVWLIKTYLGVEHGYVNEQGFWTRDLYQGDQLTKRTWFENGTKFEAHYENGKLAKTYGTGPDGIKVRYNVRGEKTEATYYNEKGLEVRDSYTNDQVYHRMYYDDAGMHVNETYNEAGELKEISYDYTDIYGERQNFSKGFGAREEISFVGDTQITTNYREDETMERRITFGPELTTIETFDEKGELIEKTVNGKSPRSEGGFVLVLQSKTYLNEDGKWILEMYDEQENIISTEETMKPE